MVARAFIDSMKLAQLSSLLLAALATLLAQPGPGPGPGAGPGVMRSLKGVPVPEPVGLEEYVRDRATLVALGKAFFWDMQAGSDGRTACATCHFHAGADMRSRNQLVDPGRAFAVNQDLTKISFPLRQLADPHNRNSPVLADSSARVGSAGTFRRQFEDIVPGAAAEMGADLTDDPSFTKGDLYVRRVTTRNSPSVINSVFYTRGFWDGRASRIFNGFTVSGDAATVAQAPGLLESRDGLLVRRAVRLDNSPLASQAVGPVLDHLEMSYAGRSWPKLGQKMLNLPPLAFQRVSVQDSVLGPFARGGDLPGLQPQYSYRALIQAAFEPRYWESLQLVDESGAPVASRGFTQAEYNFPLFWALALQAYQSTLVSDDSRFDRFAEGDPAALTAEEHAGLQIFQNQGRCATCHGGPEFSNAVYPGNRPDAFERTGVRPAAEDLGAGNGQFKSVTLRNVELTGPYFHNGGAATLEQVVEFYIRGGDFNPVNDIRPFNVSPAQKAALVAFLKALTDDRVRHERAPFDHPELCVPDGHPETDDGALLAGEIAPFWRSAAERWIAIRESGANGNAAPLRTFEELLRNIGSDGSRAHAAGEACTAPLP